MSARFASFPQTIVLRFAGFVKLKQVQFLSHEEKIATKIELHTFIPNALADAANVEDVTTFPYKRIGYLSLASNEKTRFSARELKSVYLDIPAYFLKLVFQKNHANGKNLFNQVGIIAINCLGEVLETPPDPLLQAQPQSQIQSLTPTQAQAQAQGGQPGSLVPSEYDPTTFEKLCTLNLAKEKAVAAEDFDEAKRLKDTMDRLKSVGKKLAELEQKKKAAVQNEDYETAKCLKREIDKIRDNAFAEAPRPSRGPASRHEAETRTDTLSAPNNPVLENEKNAEAPLGRASTGSKLRGPAQATAEPEAEDIKGPQLTAEEMEAELQAKLRGSIVVPVMANKNKKAVPPPSEEPEEVKDPGSATGQPSVREKAEPLSEESQKLAEPYETLFQLPLLEMLFSKNWLCREAGVDTLKAEFDSKQFEFITMEDPEQIMTMTVGLMSHLVNDKVSNVALKAMGVVETVLQFYPEAVNTSKSTFLANVDCCLGGLLEKLGDSNPKVRARAAETALSFRKQPCVGLGIYVGRVTKTGGTSAAAKKGQTSTRHIQGKLGLLCDLVKHFGTETKGPASQAIIDFALAGVKNSSLEVRNAAYALLVAVYKLIGGKINSYIDDLRPAQKELLQAEFDKAGGSPAAHTSGTAAEPGVDGEVEAEAKAAVKAKAKVEREEGLGGQGATGTKIKPPVPKKAAVKQAQSLLSPSQSKKDKACDYCGKFDPHFTTESLDMHMFSECPMLYLCEACDKIVEVISINSHRLNECANKQKYAPCSVCHEAFPIDELDAHIEEGACQPCDPKSAIRCPLCHMDIQPNTIEMWRQHILIKQCPNNDRRPL